MDLIASYREIRDGMLADIKHWREHGWKLHHNNADITEKWLADQPAACGFSYGNHNRTRETTWLSANQNSQNSRTPSATSDS
jgi:hypothetical protein